MQRLSEYQAIIFDLDGTLIDSAPSILDCFTRIILATGLKPLVPVNSSLIGPPLRNILMKLTDLPSEDVILDALVDAFKETYDSEGYKATRVYDGVEEMLVRIAATNVPMLIATNKRRIPTLKIINHLGWQNYFNIVGTLDTTGAQQPDKAALIGALLDATNSGAGSCLYVGDKFEDGEAARANGMPFVIAGWGYGEWDVTVPPIEWIYTDSPQKFIELLS